MFFLPFPSLMNCLRVCVCCLYFYLTQQKIQKQYFNRTHYSSHKDTHDFHLQFYTHGPSKMINVFTK